MEVEVEESATTTSSSTSSVNQSQTVTMVTDVKESTGEMEESSAVVTGETTPVSYREYTERPVYRMSVKLIDTYKNINKIYYEAKAKKLRENQGKTRGGVHNDGYDDKNYDYLIQGDEIFAERYILKHRIGKGSFGQVVCAYDRKTQCDVAIKIIKSKHAFMVQARTEIRLLELTADKNVHDDSDIIVKLLDTFVYRNHQCLVFEMLSYNLYELLKNTKFRGVSLALVRKFCKQILRGLEFLAREDVDIIHCDLKPENILLRHPKRSAIKIIDFGSSCNSTKKMYTYIQSRFYRSPEVLLGLSYDQKIDMWSLGCVLVEMHTGEPLFGGVDQLDQLNRIVAILGMVPPQMVADSPIETRNIFFEKIEVNEQNPLPPEKARWTVTITDPVTGNPQVLYLKPPKNTPESKRLAWSEKTVEDVIGVTTGGPQGRRKDDPGHTVDLYRLFADLVKSMLIFQPSQRVSAKEALNHVYLMTNIEYPAVTSVTNSESSNSRSSSQSKQKQQQKEKQEITLPDTSTIDSTLPRRRSRSAPRLTNTDNSLLSSSSQPSGGNSSTATRVVGSSDKDVDSTTSSTQEEEDSTQHSSKKLATAPSTAGLSGNTVNKTENVVVMGDKNEKMTHSDVATQHQQQQHGNTDGPMETSEVDDEGTFVVTDST